MKDLIQTFELLARGNLEDSDKSENSGKKITKPTALPTPTSISEGDIYKSADDKSKPSKNCYRMFLARM